MEVATYTAEGVEAETVRLPESIFDGEVNEAVLHQVVTAIRAHGRQGTASTKTRTTITGGGRKPWRQKGTGRARHGSIRSPLWKGGAVTFGPQPRDYDPKVPRRLRRLAVRSALNARALEGDLALFHAPEMEAPRTRTIAGMLSAIGADGRKVMLLTDGLNEVLYLSARNIPNVKLKPWGEMSAHDVLWADLVLIEAGALEGTDAATAGADEEREEG